MLKGQAKKDYQKRYMRKRRASLKLNSRFVRPIVRPSKDAPWYDRAGVAVADADGNVIPS